MENSTEIKTNILENAIARIAVGNFDSLNPEVSTGIYEEQTNSPEARYFKDMMFPKFSRNGYGFPNKDEIKTEKLVFNNGRIQGIRWELNNGSSRYVEI